MKFGADACKKFIRYITSNMTRVLLFAVILSAGLMMNLVTKAKYTSYVNTYHHAVAGEFYFTSNYLDEIHLEKKYVISNWSRDSYEVTLRIQNFENALLYNDADTGCYYCVEAVMYLDENYTQPDNTFVPIVQYQSGLTEVSFGGKTYVYLPGQTGEFDKSQGTHLVTVKMQSETEAESTRYMKITAKTMSPTQMKAAMSQGAISSIPTGPVFHSELAAKFELRIHSGAVIETILGTKANSSEIIYELRCLSTDGGAASRVKVFYDPTVLKFEDSLKYEVKQRGDTPTDPYRYIELDVYSTSITKLVFFKRRMTDVITSDANLVQGENIKEKHIYYEIVRYED